MAVTPSDWFRLDRIWALRNHDANDMFSLFASKFVMENAMRLDIESLRAVKTVADSGGVTRAAARLHLTQSAVSHKIKRLEDRIGRPLFRRAEGGWGPTEDGARLLRYAERLLAVHDEAVAQLARRDLAGSLRLGITEDTTGAGIAGILARFARLYPKVSLSARVEQSLVLRERLERVEIDLAVVQVFERDIAPGDLVLWRDDLLWVQSPDFEPAAGGRLPFVAFDQNCLYRRWAEAALAETGPALEIVLECPSFDGVRSAANCGLGVTIINRRNLRSGLVETALSLPGLPRVAYVVRAAKPKPAPAVAALKAASADELSEEDPAGRAGFG